MERKDCETAETTCVAIELSKASWLIGALLPDRDRPGIYRLPGGDCAGVLARSERSRPRAADRGLVCFEAGHDGFRLARFLTQRGIEVRIPDPASSPVNRRARRAKTDRVDALALLNALVAIDRGERHVCSVVRVLSVEEEDARRSHRERDRLIHERTAHINRIKGLLFAQGIRDIEPRMRRTRIDFGAMRTAEGHPLPTRLRSEPEREYVRLDMVQEQLRSVGKERDMAGAQDPAIEAKRQSLERLQGIGGTASSMMAREVFARSFSSRRHLASCPGLTPGAYDSGSVTRCQGSSKAGNSWARRVLIEISWLWLRYQPETALAHWYSRRTRGQGLRIRRVMLVALARKLAIVLWRYAETGVLPNGAVLSRQAA